MPVPVDHTDTICVWTDGLIIKTVAHWQSCQRPHTSNKTADSQRSGWLEKGDSSDH